MSFNAFSLMLGDFQISAQQQEGMGTCFFFEKRFADSIQLVP